MPAMRGENEGRMRCWIEGRRQLQADSRPAPCPRRRGKARNLPTLPSLQAPVTPLAPRRRGTPRTLPPTVGHARSTARAVGMGAFEVLSTTPCMHVSCAFMVSDRRAAKQEGSRLMRMTGGERGNPERTAENSSAVTAAHDVDPPPRVVANDDDDGLEEEELE